MTDRALAEYDSLILGEFLGEGISRKVYVCRFDPTLVVKIESNARSFANCFEWEMWNRVGCGTKFAEYLAPCVDISACGTMLLQKRTYPLQPGQAPKMMPDFLNDFKYSNYGMLDGKVVCHDYGLPTFMNLLARGSKKVKADWTGDLK